MNSDVVYHYVRKRILSGEYPPGRSLLTPYLSQEIGVSRTPVRDALRQLETDGLVTIQARLGASVKAMGMKDYRELCAMRLALENYAAGLAAAHRTAGDVHEMKVALGAMRQLTERILAAPEEKPMLAELIQEDVRFHLAIITAAGNELIKKEILRLHLIGRVVSGHAPGQAKRPVEKTASDANRLAVLQSHDAIFEAIAQGNVGDASAAMAEHIQDIIDKQIRSMARHDLREPSRPLTEEEKIYTP